MVKTNRFVRVTSIGNIPLKALFRKRLTPVVSGHDQHVSQFKGYVLDVTLSSEKVFRHRAPAFPKKRYPIH
jgi:hypothetical protein